MGVPDDAQVVVTVGRQEYQKGHRYLIEAFANVASDHPSALLLITGRQGHATTQLEELIAKLNLDSVVRLLGHRSDVPEVLAASDMFVFPSLYEGLGGALIEALALELPVVASDLPALREVVREGEDAILVPPGDPDALGSAISSLLDDPATMEAYGARSREIFDEEFRAEDATERMVALLAAVATRTVDEREPSGVNDRDLTAILHSMHDRRGPLAGDVRWSNVGRWRSFKADFVKAHSDAGEAAVKFGDGWSREDARFVAHEEERVRLLFGALPAGPVAVPPALGWSEDPPGVALDFVEGDTLFHVLGNSSHPAWNAGEAKIAALVSQCGEAIGAYHASQGAIDDPATTATARDDLLTAARRAGVSKRTIRTLEPGLERARGYRFSPNDFILAPDGQLVMIDPPHVRKYDYIQRDVSAFTYELHRTLIGDGPMSPSHPNADLLMTLRRSFFEGYATTGPATMTRPIDEWMIRFYEVSRITGLAYARIRRKQPRGAIAPMRWAAQARRPLGSPPQEQ
jgi:hypothetical protein